MSPAVQFLMEGDVGYDCKPGGEADGNDEVAAAASRYIRKRMGLL